MSEEKYEVHPSLSMGMSLDPEVQEIEETVEESAPLLQQAPQQQSYEQPARDENFRLIRESAKRESERADRAERERERLAAQLAQYSQPNQNVQESYERIGDEELATGKQLTQLEQRRRQEQEALMKRIDEKTNYLELKLQKVTDANLKLQYPDIRQVMTDDNVRQFSIDNPHLAEGFGYIPDYEAKVLAIYHAIKNSTPQGYSSQAYAPQPDIYSKDRARVQTNAAKPRPSASIAPQAGDTPLSRANAFANDDMGPDAQLARYQEMMKYAGQRGQRR